MEEGFGGTEIDSLFLWLNFHSVNWSDSQGITCTVLVGQQELGEVAVPSAWWHRYSPPWNPIASIGKLKSALSQACKPKSVSEGKLWRERLFLQGQCLWVYSRSLNSRWVLKHYSIFFSIIYSFQIYPLPIAIWWIQLWISILFVRLRIASWLYRSPSISATDGFLVAVWCGSHSWHWRTHRQKVGGVSSGRGSGSEGHHNGIFFPSLDLLAC